MADKPFDRVVINPRERPLSSDVNQIMSNFDASIREVVARAFNSVGGVNSVTGVSQVGNTLGFLSDAFMAVPGSVGPPPNVKFRPGIGFLDDPSSVASSIGGIVGLDDPHRYHPLVLTEAAPEVTLGLNLTAADPVNPRIDLIEVKMSRVLNTPTSRDVLNSGTGIFAPATVNKNFAYVLDGTGTVGGAGALNIKTGVAAPGAVYPTNAPVVDAGYTAIGFIVVPAAAPSLVQANMGDLRKLIFPGGGFLSVGGVWAEDTSGWLGMAPPGVKVTALRNGSTYTVVIVAGGSQMRGVVNPNVGGVITGPTFMSATLLGISGATFKSYQSSANNFTGNVTVGAAGAPTAAALAALLPALQVPTGQPIITVQILNQQRAADAGGGVASATDMVQISLGMFVG